MQHNGRPFISPISNTPEVRKGKELDKLFSTTCRSKTIITAVDGDTIHESPLKAEISIVIPLTNLCRSTYFRRYNQSIASQGIMHLVDANWTFLIVANEKEHHRQQGKQL